MSIEYQRRTISKMLENRSIFPLLFQDFEGTVTLDVDGEGTTPAGALDTAVTHSPSHSLKLTMTVTEAGESVWNMLYGAAERGNELNLSGYVYNEALANKIILHAIVTIKGVKKEIGVRYNDADDALEVLTGTNEAIDGSWTSVGTLSKGLGPTAWHRLEVQLHAVTGEYEFAAAGNEVFSASGISPADALVQTDQETLVKVMVQTAAATGSLIAYFDDILLEAVPL